MNTVLTRLIALFFLSLSFILPAHAVPETYTIDPSHSYVLWQVSHFGFSEQSGKWMAHGTLHLDAAKPQNSKADVTIDVADVITGNEKLDKHLRTEFFETDKFPTATFISNKIEMTGKQTSKIYGVLTLHGVSKPVVLTAKLNKSGINPISNKQTAGFTGSATIKRSDFGVNTYLPGIGDTVKLDIHVEAYRAS